jgi:surfactin synthase thioesterase subunit/acyl carrier protein
MNAANELMAEFENICLTQLDNKIQIEQIMQAKERHNLDLAALSKEEIKPAVSHFLVEQIAIIFSMPKEDIEVNRSLRDMGIDSLMALVLMRTLELGLGTTYAMHDLLDGPTINELVDFVVLNHQSGSNQATKSSQTPSVAKKANWISFRKARPNPQARLFCLPYGGGGGSIYRQWQNDLPEEIEVCPIQLPGREDRFDEKPIGNMDQLIENLVENLQPEFNIPFAFFGHSFGSLIAFELTRALRRRGLPMPMHLFVSAFPDPRVPTKSLDNLLKQLNAININMFDMNTTNIAKLTDEQLRLLANIFNENGITEYGEHIMDKDIIKVLLPIFTGDMSLVKSHQYHDEAPLDLPITVFMGKRDTWVALEDHLNWIDHTKQKCVFHVYDSGHLFIRDAKIKQDILNKITGSLITEEVTAS